MEQKKSRRVKMTKLLLKTALIELMQEKPFSQITIKELCERADLNRTTFYLHYADQTAVLREIEDEATQKTIEYMKEHSTKSWTVYEADTDAEYERTVTIDLSVSLSASVDIGDVATFAGTFRSGDANQAHLVRGVLRSTGFPE